MNAIQLLYDALASVLYVRREGAATEISRPDPEDDYLIFHYGADGSVVGITLLFAGDMTRTSWAAVAGPRIPDDLRARVDAWYAEKGGSESGT